MEIWFLRDMQRFSTEREAIQHLQETASWLLGINWVIDKQLCVNAVISVHGHNYPVRLIYPEFFPFVPPTVYPSNPDEYWSSHQYASGALCLEWGPDTWHPDVTGAQVLESAYKLLHIENPLGTGIREVAPSRHYLSIGQTLRHQYGRFYVSRELITYLSELPDGATGSLEFAIQWQSKSLVALVQQVQLTGIAAWEDNSIPQGVRGSQAKKTAMTGVFCKTQLDSETIEANTGIKELEQLLYGV